MRRRCLSRGCRVLLRSGSYCQAHKPYQAGWHALSAGVLLRDDYRCRCGGCNVCAPNMGPPCTREATTVDHIDGNAQHNVATNLRAMCRPCNTAKGGVA